MPDIMLSIYITTYNHEKYIGQALDGILMQKTKYTFEVLIGEDLSPDGTRKVLKDYEKNFPGRFQIFYRDHNMNKEIPSNGSDLRSRCKGKYMIALEGDDYWIDENKIECQIDFLESHPDYIAVSHNSVVVDHNSHVLDELYPECKNTEYNLKYYASEILPGQLTTVMYRNIFRDGKIDTSLLKQSLVPGDRLLYFTLITHGKVYCIQEKMSAYRHVTNEGSSYSATYKYDFRESERWNFQQLKYARKINDPEAEKYAELIYLCRILQGYKKSKCTIKEVINFSKNNKHQFRTWCLYIMYKIKKDIFHHEIWV